MSRISLLRAANRSPISCVAIDMSNHWVRRLVLACSLLLVLPTGWCCPAPSAQAADRAPPHCCCCKTEPVETTDSAPAAPVPSTPCPCYDRNSTAPQVGVNVILDTPALLPSFETLPAFTPPCVNEAD